MMWNSCLMVLSSNIDMYLYKTSYINLSKVHDNDKGIDKWAACNRRASTPTMQKHISHAYYHTHGSGIYSIIKQPPISCYELKSIQMSRAELAEASRRLCTKKGHATRVVLAAF